MRVMFDPLCFRSGLRFHSSGSDKGWNLGYSPMTAYSSAIAHSNQPDRPTARRSPRALQLVRW